MPQSNGVHDARSVLREAVQKRVFPAAVAEIGDSVSPIWREAFGTLTFDGGAPSTSEQTIFDLASLTKPLATTMVLLDLVERGRVMLDERVEDCFGEWRGDDRSPVTIQDLLEHASGLPARLIDAPPETRREFEHDICTIKLEYPPRSQSLYSDLGFLLLGFLAADREGVALDHAFSRSVVNHMELITPAERVLAFGVPSAAGVHIAPTEPMDEDPRRGRRLVGEVHDNYASALRGVAGHAGLFGDVQSVGAFGRMLLRPQDRPAPFSAELTKRATSRSTVAGSSRALGWDTMLPTSSCGTRMSGSAFGHVGFTGTSLWIDPGHDRYFVLLTNRACGGGTLEAMREVRRAFHDALGAA
jgi:serine-type D-Ala-D-Ala carboxypeptidase